MRWGAALFAGTVDGRASTPWISVTFWPTEGGLFWITRVRKRLWRVRGPPSATGRHDESNAGASGVWRCRSRTRQSRNLNWRSGADLTGLARWRVFARNGGGNLSWLPCCLEEWTCVHYPAARPAKTLTAASRAYAEFWGRLAAARLSSPSLGSDGVRSPAEFSHFPMPGRLTFW